MDIVGIGTEIVECLRVGRMIERHGERFLTRVYTERELQFCQSRRHSREHFAERWAAKEAVLKALALRWHRGLNWIDIEVTTVATAEARAQLSGAVRAAAEARGVGVVLLSVSHCRAYAVAHAVALRGPAPAGPPDLPSLPAR
jgi:holo-[acyl-carrier protein] synthase